MQQGSVLLSWLRLRRNGMLVVLSEAEEKHCAIAVFKAEKQQRSGVLAQIEKKTECS